jgi:hypothetical protein
MLKSRLAEIAGLCFLLAVLAYGLEIRAAATTESGRTLWGTIDLAGYICVLSAILSVIAYRRMQQRCSLIIFILTVILFMVGEYIRGGGL